ncbi:PTS sugar transporter subunit IIA [Bacillus sp. CECT 9360]|uniref:PTS sugar transporter subunit IIA n=1 Tax=Bacillus sp. CECT 9360 TaxID=2845821 RepID=UPI001E2FB152|nr:PTS sugar transporter subunit IIA [Bacillus sp. CECT 9360]CAH0346709.1 Ascorbate-specific PTS system EIIA component [Bacillus sp. CECT 9360]
MLSEYLKENINFLDEVASWEESIKVAADPLLKKGYITPKYIQDMIDNVNMNGPYIVIVPEIAMPHAQNEGGVIKTGISFLKLKNSVLFPEGKEVNILFVLAAEDSSGHLDLISDLSSLLIDEDIMSKFKNSTSAEEIIHLIKMVE